MLADGTVLWGRGAGAPGIAVGEVCFNTSLTGYQEILTDPSYAGQIISFTFPHIGNVGTNPEDVEATTPAVRGCVLRAPITEPANWRAARPLDDWLKAHGLPALTGVDTRRLTRRIRDGGAPNGVLCHAPDGVIDLADLRARAAARPGLEGMDLAKDVTCRQTYAWDQTRWALGAGHGRQSAPRRHVVAMDFGAKHNILRCLADQGCRVTIVPADASAEDVMGHDPDGIFLSNGPGDPAATGVYAVPTIRQLLETGRPIFGICLGHQLLALALGARTHKMHMGHRGANHPVKDLQTGRVEITSQNHRLRGRPREPAPRRGRDPRLPLRRQPRGSQGRGQAGLFRPVPPRSLPRPPGQPPPLPTVRRADVFEGKGEAQRHRGTEAQRHRGTEKKMRMDQWNRAIL